MTNAKTINAVGTITIDYSAKFPKEVLQESFNNFLVKLGTVHLENVSGETVELEIHNHHEFTIFADESERED